MKQMNFSRQRAGVTLLSVAALAAMATAQVSMSAKLTWGFNGDGWWAPGENGITYLTTTNEQRSLAYNPVTNRVYVTNGLSVRGLNASTGVSEVLLDTTGIAGGTRALNTVGVSADGQVFGANLTTNSTTSAFKLYRWANEGAAPVSVFSGANLAGSRIGDDMAVYGSGNNVVLANGYGTTPAVTGNNSYAIHSWDGSSINSSIIAMTGTNAGDFRLGIGFNGSTSEVWGTQGAGGTSGGRIRRTTYSGTAGTLVQSYQLSSASERGLALRTFNGFNLLATVDTVSSVVRIYDVNQLVTSGPNTALTSLDLANPDVANANATSAVVWGASTGNTLSLYVLNSNNGIQAFDVQVVPEPGTMIALGAGLAAVAARRRRKA